MSDRRQKLWKSIAQHPSAVRFEDMARLLELSGWRLERIRGSHHVFGRGADQIVVPLRRPHVLSAYVRDVLRLTIPEKDAEE